ncbi:hypothetical protein C8Q77DRAFT_1144655 [Trametes polyzona]|nr:hypothetical protein C8Q77DRAFT_1144655 [Trametes polyzona]
MDRAALSKLKRTELQKLAKRDGVRANGKTAEIIEGLLRKHGLELVPCLEAEPQALQSQILADEAPKQPTRVIKLLPPRRSRCKLAATDGVEAHKVDKAINKPTRVSTMSPRGASQACEKRDWAAEHDEAARPSKRMRVGLDNATKPTVAIEGASACIGAADTRKDLSQIEHGSPEFVCWELHEAPSLSRPASLPQTAAETTQKARSPSRVSDAPTEPAWTDAPAPPSQPPVYRPTIASLKAMVTDLGKQTSEDEQTQHRLYELRILIDSVAKRKAKVQEGVRRMQKLRLALEQHLYGKIKEDPRIMAGIWTRPQAATEQRVDVSKSVGKT